MSRPQTPARRDNAPAPAMRPPADFRKLIEESSARLADVIPAMMRRFLTPERVIRLSLAAYSRKRELRECDPLSILNCIIQASQMGFEADGPLGHAYLVPYKGICTLQIGYKGFCDLARRTAGYDLIDSRLVHAKDSIRVEYTPAPLFQHFPTLSGERGAVVHAYAYAFARGSERPIFEIMSADEIGVIRSRLASGNSPAWKDYPGEMQKKIVLKRMLKDQPLSIELADAIAYDNEVNAAVASPARRPPLPAGSRSLALARQLAGPDGEPEFPAGTPTQVYTEDGDADIVPEEITEIGAEPGRQPGEEG